MDAYRIEPFDFVAASDDELRRVYAYHLAIQHERTPADPPGTFEAFAASARTLPDFIERRAWLAYEPDGAVVGRLVLILNYAGDNRHAANLLLDVIAAHRRRGIARRLLAAAAQVAQRDERRLLLFETVAHLPAGIAFVERLGARRGMAVHTNQLDLAELDHGLMRRWQERAAVTAVAYELGFWDGAIPDADLSAMAALMDVMNSAPREELELEDDHFSPEQLRERERALFAGGRRRLTSYTRERASGVLVGYSEIYWSPGLPTILLQGDTGVSPAHRGHGLGKWLKAANLGWALREFPEARFVRTGNADSNAPMLAINHAMGFRPFMEHTYWQVETAQVLAWAVPPS